MGNDELKIKKKDFFPLRHYDYGEAYFGSYKGMRYRLAREPLENVVFTPVDQRSKASLLASVWKEPYAYGYMKKDDLTSEMFEISEEGFDKAIRWINEQYDMRKDEWSKDSSILD
ncbi:hypothetical protein [Butyrivibrio sp. NC3005]|uniref:hypothetical protein n=1 Tax=Butyrivibrio sp. NC3005 TaxID=1280685 RepID=UPI00040AB1DF|nr:hypothetical protein [Butyrivibrio sp. NC3005]